MIQATVTTAPYLVTRRTVNNDYDLIARKTQMDNILLIPGLDRPNPNNLFRDGQVGGWLDPYDLTKMWVDNAGTTPMTASDLGVGIGRIQSKGGPVITFEQATSGDRLVWGRHPVSGIRNLASWTEDFGNAYWTKSRLNLIANATTSPDGTISAFKAIPNTDDSTHSFFSGTVANPGTSRWTASVYFKAAEYQFASIYIGNTPLTVTARCRFDLVNGVFSGLTTVGSGFSNLAANVQNQGNGWFRAILTADVDAALTELRLVVLVDNNTPGSSYPGDDVSGIFIWGTQLERSATVSSYQRVTNRFDITETGQPDLYYFSGNGVNQSWSSNATVDFSGTDKVTVWAGVRKLSDAARGILCEFGDLGTPTSGSFAIDAPAFPPSSLYRWQSSGSSVAATSSGNAAYTAPHTASLVGIGEISSDTCQLQINGETVSSATDQGSGNYGNHTLHIGRRGGSSLPFNGYIYSLIIAGDNYDTRTIQQFSDWLLKPRRLITA